MMGLSIRCWAGLALLLTALPAPADDFSSLLARIGFDQQPGSQVPLGAVFQDAAGRELRLGELLDGERPVILVPAYYHCPKLCSVNLETLAGSLSGVPLEPGRDYRVVVYSIDPAETPAEAARKQAELAPRLPQGGLGWSLLTGGAGAIAALSRAIGFRAEYDRQLDQFAHAAGAVLLTPSGQVSRYLLGVGLPTRDLHLGLVEAGQGTIGGIVERLLLLCYDYNPRTGQYSLWVLQVLKLAGVATLLLLAGGIGLLLLRERWTARRTARRGSP